MGPEREADRSPQCSTGVTFHPLPMFMAWFSIAGECFIFYVHAGFSKTYSSQNYNFIFPITVVAVYYV
jgi:hypothetical protein